MESTLIWIDGPCGVGKTTVCDLLHSRLGENYEIIDSDAFDERLIEENSGYPFIGKGTRPQNNEYFLSRFHDFLLQKTMKSTDLIVQMALSESEARDTLYDIYSKSIHIILTASNEIVVFRNNNDDKRDPNNNTASWAKHDIQFLEENYPDAIRVDTERKCPENVAAEVYAILLSNQQ